MGTPHYVLWDIVRHYTWETKGYQLIFSINDTQPPTLLIHRINTEAMKKFCKQTKIVENGAQQIVLRTTQDRKKVLGGEVLLEGIWCAR